MIDTNDIIIGSIAFVLAYTAVRFLLVRKKPDPIQQKIQEIISGEEYKVKGRVESRADSAE